MSEVELVFQELDALLADHYACWQGQASGRVRVYAQPEQRRVAQTPSAALAPTNGASPMVKAEAPHRPTKAPDLGEVVANVFLFVLLSVLSDKLTQRRLR